MNTKVLLPLSPREFQVLRLMADGREDKQIAYELDVSLTTVKRYGEQIRYKLNAEDRTHAVAIGFRNGLLT